MNTTLETVLLEHLRFFVETIGPRPAGSLSCLRAADTIRRAFYEAGLQVEEIAFDCLDWRHRRTVLATDGETLAAKANMHSPPCRVTAPLAAVCTPAELEAAEVTGKVLLMYGDLLQVPLIPLNCRVYNTERDQQINRLLIERKPAALIAFNPNPPAMDGMIEDPDLPIPSLTVPAEVGLCLLDRVGEAVSVTIEAERVPSQAITLVGTKPSASPAKIVLMAHYDTKMDTPGAADNATGIAGLLALAQLLAPKELPVGLEFIAFGDEEYYAYTDGMYVERHGEELGNILLAINMDFMGQRLGANTIALMSASDAVQQAIDGLLAAYPGVVWTEPWPQSNHSTFAYRGVPSVAFSSKGVKTIYHQPSDTMAWVDAGKVQEVVSLIIDILAAVQDKPVEWTRPSA